MITLFRRKPAEQPPQQPLYTPGLYLPFAERKPSVVQFEFTEGCSYGACTFCDMYHTPYHEKSVKEGKKHVDDVLGSIPESRVQDLERIFIANGDVIKMDPLKLNELVQYSIGSFVKKTGSLPRRVALFGSTRNILAAPRHGLEVLRCGGTCSGYLGLPNFCSKDSFGQKAGVDLVYWGLESGSDEVLKYLGKGCSSEDHIEANDILDDAGIRKSVTVMAGAGGIKHSQNHLEKTVDLLNRIEPEFITFIGINPSADTVYSKRMEEEVKSGTNRPLNDHELARQTLDMVKGLDLFTTTVGCFDSTIQDIGKNPFSFGSVSWTYYDGSARRKFLSKQEARLKKSFHH